jgi:hypothetical protein
MAVARTILAAEASDVGLGRVDWLVMAPCSGVPNHD